MINVGPGQRETIRGGRDQDLLTPFWQMVALFVFGAWCLMWLVFIALVVGPIFAFVFSAGVFLIRLYIKKRSSVEPLLWIVTNVIIHTAIAVCLDAIWTSYVLGWTPWIKMIWSSLCVLMIAPAAWFYYHVVIRIADPNYTSPRKAVEQRQPQMPWYRDEPAEPTPMGPRLLTVQVESTDPRYHSGVLDLPPVREWYDFALWVLRNPTGFSEPNAKRFGVKLNLKSDKPPWYGRGFRQVRNDLFERTWARWIDESAHEQGIALFAEALAAFHEYCENGPPPP